MKCKGVRVRSFLFADYVVNPYQNKQLLCPNDSSL